MGRFRPHRMYPGALLAQEACSYQGSTELLARLRGRIAVIIHSDRDCSNVLPKTGGRIHSDLPYKFVCTNLKEDELVTGQGNAKLQRAIELVAEAWQPDLICVLSTCPTVMIGDNLRNVAQKTGQRLGIRVVAEVTHGLRPQSPAEIVDTVYTTLTRASRPTLDDVGRRVVLAGLDLRPEERAEIEAVLTRLGLTLGAVLNSDAHLDDFLRAADAGYLIHPGPNLLLSLGKQARAQWGQQVVEVPLPYGVTATLRFWQAIAQATGTQARLDQALADLLPQAQEAVADFQARHRERGLRCAYNVGSVRSFDLRRIALEELGELPMLQELGLDCDLFIQGPQGEDNQRRTAAVLRDLGLDLPFALFPAPGSLRQFLRPGQYALFYGPDFLADQTSQLSLPLLQHWQPQLGLGGVAGNVALVDQALSSRFYTTFQPHVASPEDPGAVVGLRRPSEYLAVGVQA